MHKILFAFILIAISLFIGCNAATPTPQVNQAPVQVDVSLGEFKIDASLKNFQTGVPYHFVVTNNGSVNHEFMISPQMMKHNMGGTMSMAEMDKMAVAMIHADDLPPGATKTLDVTFTQPSTGMGLELACWVAGHHEAGMFLPIGVN